MTLPSLDDTLARARSALDMPTLYWLGQGGWTAGQRPLPTPGRPFDPMAALTALKADNPAKHAAYTDGLQRLGLTAGDLPRSACDCSGFVAWCLGLPRHPVALNGQADQWLYTDSIVADALGRRHLFTPLNQAKVGALLVFPSAGHRRPVGHVAWITAVTDGRAARILHCAPQNFEVEPTPGQPRNAIAETGTTVFEGEVAADTMVVGVNAFLEG
ncbi:MAG: CHAP domain-containing protein [Burkholderiaceae bacterium]|nr:CHAP domain-containing protein [Rhodoferax sp.]MCP5283563.1 CHAP domain-containing protein [Burkholderiaceae bacterium]